MVPSQTIAVRLLLLCCLRSLLAVRNRRPCHIALFSNGGWYSHDALTNDLAQRLVDSGYKVTVIEIRMFNMNSTVFDSGKFSVLRHQYHEADSSHWLRSLQSRMWHDSIPFAADHLFKVESIRVFRRFYDVHLHACETALRNRTFMHYLLRLKLDLVVVDCILNECGFAMASLLNVPRVYMSNYPIVEQYADYTGVLANPAYVPSIFSKEVGRMAFSARTYNFIYRVLSAFVRGRILTRVERLFSAEGYHLPDLRSQERANVFYGTPFERLLDTPRPTIHSFKYFGCADCLENNRKHVEIPYKMKKRRGIILVSFGSIPSGGGVPKHVADAFSYSFSRLPDYNVIFQLPNVRDVQTTFPANVVPVDWMPLTQLLSHPSVMLFVSHGGIRSLLEAVGHAVPVLGIPMHGDQTYNLGRFREKGLAEVLQVARLSEQELVTRLSGMLSPANVSLSAKRNRNPSLQYMSDYRTVAKKYRSMIMDSHSLLTASPVLVNKTEPVFWIDWTVKHFPSQAKVRLFIELKFPTNLVPHLMLNHVALGAVSCALLVRMFL